MKRRGVLAGHTIDVVLFTSSIQLDHLLKTASKNWVFALQVQSALTQHAALASGRPPSLTAALKAAGLPADIIPIHPKMAGLVRAAADTAAEVLARKRAPR